MQPYLLPYIGYYQLIDIADKFVIYDTIQYTKKGWINRNRMLRNGAPVTFTVPVAKGSDYLNVRDRYVADSYDPAKLVAQIEGAYRKAPHFGAAMPVIRDVLDYRCGSLFDFLKHGLERTCAYLGVETEIVVASDVEGETDLRGQDRVVNLCRQLRADEYVNPIGGLDLYDAGYFVEQDIKLDFIRTTDVAYTQFDSPFQPNLSIVDVMMFNDPGQISMFLKAGYEHVAPKDPGDVPLG